MIESKKLRYFSHAVNTNVFKCTNNKNDVNKLLCVANNGYANNQSYDRKGFVYAIKAAKELGYPITIAGPSNNVSIIAPFTNHNIIGTIVKDPTKKYLLPLSVNKLTPYVVKNCTQPGLTNLPWLMDYIRPNIVTTWGQFHQHFTCTFLPIYPFDKKSPSRSVIREKMCKTLSYEKRTRKMLMKLTSVGSWVVCSSRRWLSKITHNNIIYGTYCLKHLVCFSKACLIKKG